MKQKFRTLLVLFVFFLIGFGAHAQTTTVQEQERDVVSRYFKIENYTSEMTEKAMWVLVREHSDMMVGCSINLSYGSVKLEVYPEADVRQVMKIFYEHQYILTFKDEQGVKKGYNAETGELKTVE